MNIFESIILGVVEGLTEFLPISSTGHLILTSTLLGIEQTEFLKTFEIVIQLGAICAVLSLFWRSLLNIEVLKRLFIAFIPTALIGFLAYPFIKGVLLESPLTVVVALFLGGIALIVFELFHTEREDAAGSVQEVSYKQSFIIGLFQSIAMVPGVSRSAATLVGGLLMGIKRVAIVEFAFLLAIPTMLAATGYDVLKSYENLSSDNLPILAVGFITSFIVAILAVKFLLSYVKNHSFIAFGIYRIILAALFFLFVL